MRIYLPEKFDTTKDIKGYNKGYHEKYLWLIHTIVEEKFKNKNDFYGYVNLQVKIIEYYLGPKYYNIIIEALEESRIIERNKSYQVGSFSRSYRLTKKFQGKIRRENFVTGKAQGYIKKLKSHKSQIIKQIPNDSVYRYLWKNLLRLSIDAAKAREFLEENKADYSIGEMETRQWAIDKFEISDFYFNVDTKSGRVFNNLVSLPRELKQFLTLGDKELVQMDVSNSQPLLLCPLLSKYWVDRLDAFNELKESVKDFNIPRTFYIVGGHSFDSKKVVEGDIPTNDPPEDITLYISLTQKGSFYTDFMEYLKKQGIKYPTDRREFKEEFFKRVFFSTVDRSIEYKYEKWFEDWMPNVSTAINWYKRDDHAELANRLQETEATVIMDSCREILAKYPTTFFLTIHDAIICCKEDAVVIQGILLAKFRELYNLNPKAEIKGLKE